MNWTTRIRRPGAAAAAFALTLVAVIQVSSPSPSAEADESLSDESVDDISGVTIHKPFPGFGNPIGVADATHNIADMSVSRLEVKPTSWTMGSIGLDGTFSLSAAAAPGHINRLELNDGTEYGASTQTGGPALRLMLTPPPARHSGSQIYFVRDIGTGLCLTDNNGQRFRRPLYSTSYSGLLLRPCDPGTAADQLWQFSGVEPAVTNGLMQVTAYALCAQGPDYLFTRCRVGGKEGDPTYARAERVSDAYRNDSSQTTTLKVTWSQKTTETTSNTDSQGDTVGGSFGATLGLSWLAPFTARYDHNWTHSSTHTTSKELTSTAEIDLPIPPQTTGWIARQAKIIGMVADWTVEYYPTDRHGKPTSSTPVSSFAGRFSRVRPVDEPGNGIVSICDSASTSPTCLSTSPQ